MYELQQTDYLPVISKTAIALVDASVIRVGDATATASRFVRTLGVVIDRHFDFKGQKRFTVSWHTPNRVNIK